MSRRTWAIIRREYLQRVRSRWFIFSTLFVPVLMVAAMLLPAVLIESSSDGPGKPIAIIDESGDNLAPLIMEALAADSVAAELLPEYSTIEIRAAASSSDESPYRGYLLVPSGALEARTATLFESESLGRRTRSLLQMALAGAIIQRRLEDEGTSPELARELMRPASLEVERLDGGSDTAEQISQVIGFVIAMILYMMFVVYGQMIARGVLEEKTSDIVEIMVSSVRPREMMLGKILGVGAVGLTQVGIWGAIGAGLFLYSLAGAAPLLAEAGMDLSAFVFPWSLLGQGLIYLVLGYLLYASMFASAGAMLSNENDVQQVLLPVTLPIIVPVVIMPVVIERPEETWIAMVSMVPFFSPILMVVRSTVGEVPVWQTLTAMLLLVGSVLLMARVAGRIYRVGILMKGKRPNLPEMLRWMRHG
ncbi:MAG: ABC transporter permease [Gemmatimonadota bacterium]